MSVILALPIREDVKGRSSLALAHLFAAMSERYGPRGGEWDFMTIMGSPDFPLVINKFIRHFHKTERDRMFVLDDDEEYDPRDVMRLMESEHDWIGANYSRRAFGKGMASTPKAGGAIIGPLVEAESLASGFWSVSRTAITRLIEANPDTFCIDDLGEPIYALAQNGPMDGVWMAGDAQLCKRWQRLGEVCWIDTSIRVNHIGTHVYAPEDSIAHS